MFRPIVGSLSLRHYDIYFISQTNYCYFFCCFYLAENSLASCVFICRVSSVLKKMRKVVLLKEQVVDASMEGGTLSQQWDKLIRQRDCTYRQRYRTLVWVFNVGFAPVEEEGEEDERHAQIENASFILRPLCRTVV